MEMGYDAVLLNTAVAEAGDPVRMAGALFHSHDRKPYMDMVRDFLVRSMQDTNDDMMNFEGEPAAQVP